MKNRCLPPPSKSLLVSILSLGRPSNVQALLTELPRWLDAFARDSSTDIHILVRNNDPRICFDDVRERLAQCEAEHPALRCTLVTGQPNLGFGRGHNENYRLSPADYILILNDDIGFPHLDWLPEAVSLLAQDPRTACIGATENPRYLNPMFGNGNVHPPLAVETLKYAEASVLLLSGPVFERVGMFDERFQWAMCEDADLSLRAQQLGYRLRWISMPHQHWRSTSVNSLPAPVKASIIEHNRATLFASWSHALATGRLGRLEVFDLWSDGTGDVFCGLPHLLAWLDTLTLDRRERIVVNIKQRELAELLGIAGIRITSVADRNDLLEAVDAEGVATLHTMGDINYGLPMNIHPLLCGMLGLPICSDAGFLAFRALLRRDSGTVTGRALPDSYCVVHLEFMREHDGRSLTPASIKSILAHCARLFDSIVLVGRERRLAASLCGAGRARVIDLQGKLLLRELISVIAGASYFVGIDSFPAHVAQAAGVRSAVFFGAVHPLARVWNEAEVWPLVAGLDCIGCYHTDLEPSVPFCMRRDQACASGPDSEHLEQALQAMLRGEPYPWSTQRRRFSALQAKWLGFMRHHTSPPERLLRPAASSNVQVSDLVYRILDLSTGLASSRYRTTSITDLTERVRELESELFDRTVELDEVRHARPEPPAIEPVPPFDARRPGRIMQLNSLALRWDRCTIQVSGQWLTVRSVECDPLLFLPPIRGNGGRVQLRLISVADRVDSMQVFWALGEESFTEERQRTAAISPETSTIDLSFDLEDGEILSLRVDPLTARGKVRLRGSISGAFEPLEMVEPSSLPDEPRRRPARKRATA